MARVTVEDCLKNVRNRFDLVMLATKRARLLKRGTVNPTVEWGNDKATVVALRELAAGSIDVDHLRRINEYGETPEDQANAQQTAQQAASDAFITSSEEKVVEQPTEVKEQSGSTDSAAEQQTVADTRQNEPQKMPSLGETPIFQVPAEAIQEATAEVGEAPKKDNRSEQSASDTDSEKQETDETQENSSASLKSDSGSE